MQFLIALVLVIQVLAHAQVPSLLDFEEVFVHDQEPHELKHLFPSY